MLISNCNNISPSATLSLNDKINKLIEQGKDITHFGFGGSPFQIPEFFINSLKNNSHYNQYLPVKGLVPLREKIANYYTTRDNHNVSLDNVIIGPGSKELLFLIQMSFISSSIYIPTPTWVSYMSHAKLANHDINYIHTTYENNWKITVEDLENTFNTQQHDLHKILILNTPSNPTGAVYSEDQLIQLANYLENINITIIIDEIYENQVYNNSYMSLAKYLPNKCIITSGLSKSMAAGGWRLGWCIIPPALQSIQDTLTILASETYSTVCSPIQYATLSLFDDKYISLKNNYWNKSNCILKALTTYCTSHLKENNVKCHYPEASWYVFIDLTYYSHKFKNIDIHTSVDLANTILNDIHIAILPGVVHGIAEHYYTARLCLVCFDGKLALEKCPDNYVISHEWLHTYCHKTIAGIEKLTSWLLQL